MNKPGLIFMLFMCIIHTELYSHSIHKEDSIKSQKNKNIFNKITEYLENSNENDTTKKFDISFIGGPHYSNETKLGLGLVASGLYRLDKSNLTISPSTVSLYGDFTTSGSLVLGIEGSTIFPEDKYRLNFNLFLFSRPSKYWGIGYDNGDQKHKFTKYTKKDIQIKIDFLRKMPNHIYFGVTTSAQEVRGTSFRDLTFLNDERSDNVAIGGGFLIGVDSRDFIPNPSRGYYINLEQNFYPTVFGSTYTFNRTNIILRNYQPLWNGATLAIDAEGLFNSGHVPWSMMALLGSPYQMRGYYNGQYRDRKLLQTQCELRQHIYRRHGVVLWTGAGNCFNDFDNLKWKQTLVSAGVGYRWEFKDRVNLRLDYGIGKGQSGFYFQINEAF